MSDISEARQRIRDLVTPLKRCLLSYHIEETLGKSDPCLSGYLPL